MPIDSQSLPATAYGRGSRHSAPQTPPPLADRLRSLLATPYRLGVLVLLALMLAWRGWTMSRWSWYMDDWIYLSSSVDTPFGEFISQNYNGHLMPGQFLLSLLVTSVAPLQFWMATILVAAMAVASVVAE